jgi:hypothetical protein
MAETERAILKGTILSTVQIRNLFTAQVTEGGGDLSHDLWSTYMLALINDIGDLMSATTHFYEYEVQRYTGGHWLTLEIEALDFAGSVSGDLLPYQAALVLIGKAAGLRQIGRKFIGGLTETMTAGGVLTSTLITAAAQTLTDFLAPVNGLGSGLLQPGILDKTGVFRPFVGGTVSSVLGSMRRRKPGLGI